jgi:hypothetical protein
MTFIHVMTPQGRINAEQRRMLAKTLTDAVLVPEVGRLVPEARRGYQVHFLERPLDMIAHSGELLSDKPSDVMVLDVVVMDCCWTRGDREAAIRNIFAGLTEALGMKAPSPNWWINFRVIEEGKLGFARRRALVQGSARPGLGGVSAGARRRDPYRAISQIRPLREFQHERRQDPHRGA